LTSTLCMDVDWLLTCPIQASYKEVIVGLTLTITGATPRSLMVKGFSLKQHPIQISKFSKLHPQESGPSDYFGLLIRPKPH
jgi:hypothetical protein